MKQNACVIIGACPVHPEMISFVPENAFIIAADAGWKRAAEIGLCPDLIIGDFDSAPPPEDKAEVLCLPAEKDDTDTNYAVNYALDKGYRKIILIGVLGGRFDHSLASLQSLMHITSSGAEGLIADINTEIRCVKSGYIKIEPRPDYYLSIFALGEPARDVNLKGVKYMLKDAIMSQDYPIGISNEFTQQDAVVGCGQGTLIVMLVRKKAL